MLPPDAARKPNNLHTLPFVNLREFSFLSSIYPNRVNPVSSQQTRCLEQRSRACSAKEDEAEFAMKYAARYLLIAVAAVAPALAHADPNQPLTRAQVRQELVDLEKAGYDPSIYVGRIRASMERAQAIVAQQHAAEAQQHTADIQQITPSADVELEASK
ncbi:hypothetical protein GCM10027093_73650 [Paraburkholderia jirisanensis]